MNDNTPSWLIKFLNLTAKYEILFEFFHRCDGEWAPVTFFTNCNDVFGWALSDGEEIRSLEDVQELEKAINDCIEAITDKSMMAQDRAVSLGITLYSSRRRRMRPQGACYPSDKELWPLFDACGPEREIDFGNPLKPGEKIKC